MADRSITSGRSRAFTLVELLVTVGIVALILGLILPALRGARWKVDDVALLAHQSQVFKSLDQYLADHDLRYPSWGQSGTAHAVLALQGKQATSSWWEQPIMWGAYLESKGYEGQSSAMAGAGPMRKAENIVMRAPPDGFMSIHQLTHCAYATPEHFAPAPERMPSVRDHVAQRASTLAYAADKGVLIQFAGLPSSREPESLDASFPIAFGDGHCEMPRFHSLRPGVDVQHAAVPVLATERGLLGRDK